MVDGPISRTQRISWTRSINRLHIAPIIEARIAAVVAQGAPPGTLLRGDAVNGSDFLGRQLP
jgi:hypothetical protein